jgi:small subunit ribosomal protein S15
MVFILPSTCSAFSVLGSKRVTSPQCATRRARVCALAGLRLQTGEDTFDFFLGKSERTTESLLPMDGSDLPEGGGNKTWLNLQRVRAASARFRVHERDTGSPEYQIAALTERVNIITEHLKEHPKDLSSTRGLQLLNSRRRRLLRYLQSQDLERFDRLVKALNIRVRRGDTTLSRRRDLAGGR